MKNLSVLLCGAALMAAGCSTTHKSDSARLQGSWDGEALQGEPRHHVSFIISGNNYEFRDETDKNVWYKGTFSLRQDSMPRQFVALVSECPFPQYVGKTSMAIYRVEGDTLTIAGNEPGKPDAPAGFDAPDAARIELKRK
jgi:uncharacterized protein (TIGR03067 family)